MGILRKLINGQIYLSQTFDQLLPEKFLVDGNRYFLDMFIPRYLKPDVRIYDVGGGKQPYVQLPQKRQLRLVIVGLDIDRNELDRAPDGVYDEKVCADITRYRGRADADLVICQSLLEHVHNVDQAFAGIGSILRPGGIALVFVPSRNAWYARLNLLLPEKLKRQLLFSIFPQRRGAQGFPAYYDRCTPADFRRLARKHGLEVTDERCFYTSAYFTICFPVHLLWRIWILLFSALAGRRAAETFCMALTCPIDSGH